MPINELTNITRSVVSNAQGEYVFASVDPGTYTVTTVLEGFKTVDRPGIRIGTQQFLVMDLALGDVSVSRGSHHGDRSDVAHRNRERIAGRPVRPRRAPGTPVFRARRVPGRRLDPNGRVVR